MALGNGFSAASLNVNIGANTANLSAAADKAKQMINGLVQSSTTRLQQLTNGFKAVGSAAMGMGPHIGNAMRYTSASVAGAGAAVTAYTGVVVANRLEQEKLAKQFNLTSTQMNQLAYMAKYTGQETEDFADALKELSIKAGDAVEGGEKMADTMGVLYDKMGGAKKWVGENDPIKKFNALRDAFQQLNAADQVRVLDEMGDAGLKMGAALRMTNAELKMLQATGAATASAMNISAIQTLISKFGYLQQVGNDFLTGIVARFSPMFSMICDKWTKRLTDAFESKGGFKEGFEHYVDVWADKIFNFLYKTIESVMSFMDSLNNVKLALVSAANSAKGAVGGSVSKEYSDNYKLNDNETKQEEQLDKYYAERDKLNAQRIAYEKKAHLEYMKANPDSNIIARNYEVGNKLKDDAEYAKLTSALQANTKAIEPLAANRQVINAQFQAQRDPNEIVNSSKKDGVLYELKTVHEESKKNKPTDTQGGTTGGKSLSQKAFENTEAEGNSKKAQDALDKLEAFNEKMAELKLKVKEFQAEHRSTQMSELKKQELQEKKALDDLYNDIIKSTKEFYGEQIKEKKANKQSTIQLEQHLAEQLKQINVERNADMAALDREQQKGRLKDIEQFNKDFSKRVKDIQKQYQFGEGAKTNVYKDERTAIEEELEDQLKDFKEKHKEYIDDVNSYEYQQFKELQERKKQILEEYDKAALDRFYSEMDPENTVGNFMAQMKGKGQSPFPGMSNDDVANAKGNVAKQEEMMVKSSDFLMENAAKNSEKMFKIKQKMDIAAAIMSTYKAASEALSWGGIAGGIMAASTIAMGMMNVKMIQSQQFVGQAHDGIDYVWKSGTWNLEKGERVLGKDLNQDFTEMAKRINSDSYNPSKGNVNITMPVNIQGNVVDNSWFREELTRCRDTLAEQVATYNDDRGINN
ncbi:hypothetical protein [Aeromonas hydrophila]|uniref:hypothetical protein n=1 Tax=Aeromonas hydrophila TaxID=644 RepID=UPI00259D6DC9|nr:hypothetical protein [Aeromonas hydrophila]MDM5119981.1 hypothetical protein [Aeromonas hydrophila]